MVNDIGCYYKSTRMTPVTCGYRVDENDDDQFDVLQLLCFGICSGWWFASRSATLTSRQVIGIRLGVKHSEWWGPSVRYAISHRQHILNALPHQALSASEVTVAVKVAQIGLVSHELRMFVVHYLPAVDAYAEPATSFNGPLGQGWRKQRLDLGGDNKTKNFDRYSHDKQIPKNKMFKQLDNHYSWSLRLL